jgi:hypothetical protein
MHCWPLVGGVNATSDRWWAGGWQRKKLAISKAKISRQNPIHNRKGFSRESGTQVELIDKKNGGRKSCDSIV